jgi:hypothetical protein
MNIQSLSKIKVADKDDNMHQELFNFLMQLLVEMQRCLSDEGYLVPQQPTTNITQLNTEKSIGALLYDKDTHELKVNINGTFKTVQVA